MPMVGFRPAVHRRRAATSDAGGPEVGHDGGFVSRYSTSATDDGLEGTEGKFLACSFWLVTALAMNGRDAEARALFERLLALGNDLGLFSEEYDVTNRRLIGNFPQAFAHLTLGQAAKTLGLSAAGDCAARYTAAATTAPAT